MSDTKPNPFAKLLEFCNSGGTVDVFLSQDEEIFGTIRTGGMSQTMLLSSAAFSQTLRYEFTKATGLHVSGTAVRDVIEHMTGAALSERYRQRVFLRIGENVDNLYIDLGDERGKIVEVTDAGWRLKHDAPIRFYRPHGMKPLPEPMATNEKLEDLIAPFASTRNRNDRIMLLSWLIGAFKAEGPYPVLVVQSEQGTGKSSLCDLLRSLVDPNKALSRGQPKNQDELVIAAKNSRVVALDNLSAIPDWMSDCMCRIASGGGVGKRQLYSNTDEVLYSIQRPQVMNCIDDLLTRGDLLSRTIMVDLAPITAVNRQTSERYWTNFRDAWPMIFGAILNVIVEAKRNWPTATIGSGSRLGDWCKWMNAAERGLGWEEGTFNRAYAENQERTRVAAMDAQPVATEIVHLLKRVRKWEGTAKTLLDQLNIGADWSVRKLSTWPGSAQSLSGALKRLTTDLRGAGIDVVTGERLKNANRDRWIRISLMDEIGGKPEKEPFMLN
jgi:hypothetical protein